MRLNKKLSYPDNLLDALSQLNKERGVDEPFDCTIDEFYGDGDRSMFVLIENGDTYKIVYHRNTKVMYAISAGFYNMGNFTVMVDQNGKPLLYQED